MNSMNVDSIRAGKTRTILAFSVPAIISMVLTSLINVADGFFMGNFIHKDAIAVASLVSALLGFAFLLFYFLKKARVFRFVRFRFDRKVFRDTMLNGLSEFIGGLSMCISMAAYNFVIMRRIGVDGVTAFTVVGYTTYVFSMVVCGFGQGMAPLSSFVYGVKGKLLARNLFTRTVLLVLAAGCATVALVGFSSSLYSRIFVDDMAVQQMIKSGILIFMWSYILCGLNAIASFYFTSIGKAKESAVISSARGLVILLAAIFVLPAILGMNGVWLASPATEILTLVITLFYLKKDRKEIDDAKQAE